MYNPLQATPAEDKVEDEEVPAEEATAVAGTLSHDTLWAAAHSLTRVLCRGEPISPSIV